MKPVLVAFLPCLLAGAERQASLKVYLSWVHELASATSYAVRLVPATPDVVVSQVVGNSLETGKGLVDGAWTTSAGAGDVDAVRFTLLYPENSGRPIQDAHILWADLIAQSDPETVRRLAQDPAFRPGCAKLTVLLNAARTSGFIVSADQLREHGALWLLSPGAFLAAGELPLPYHEDRRRLAAHRGNRVLDQVGAAPEATYVRGCPQI